MHPLLDAFGEGDLIFVFDKEVKVIA